MKVHIIKKKTILEYIKSNINSKSALHNWLFLVSLADWQHPTDIIQTYGSADILGRGTERVVFNIGGNKYRLICTYYFGKTMVHLYINWIGTHSEYDKLCSINQQFSIQLF